MHQYTACATDIDYCDDMIRDALLRGIADDEIRLEILGHSNQKLTLEETLQLIETNRAQCPVWFQILVAIGTFDHLSVRSRVRVTLRNYRFLTI